MGTGRQKKGSRGKGSGKRRASHLPRWLRHRHFLAIEAMLVVGLLEEYGQSLLERSDWPPWLQVLLIMALVVGAFTAVVIFLQERAEKTLDRTHKIVQAMPIPTPYILVHLLLLFVLFVGYALVLGKEVLGIELTF